MTLVLPRRLYCPFPSRIHPDVALADAHTAEWLLRYGLVRDQHHLNFYRFQGFACMVGRMFPFAPRRVLFALTVLNTLLFLLDDLFDHQSQGDTDIKGIVQSFDGILDDQPQPPAGGLPVMKAVEDWWVEARCLSGPVWQERFKEGIGKIFEAALWQSRNVQREYWPTVEQYMEQRQFLGAANIATDSIALAQGVDLPDEVLDHPVVSELTVICRNSVCVANDLFSFSKECRHGDYHNLVSLVRHEKVLDLVGAVEWCSDYHDHMVRRFMSLESDLLEYSLGGEPDLQRYIDGLKAIMRANIDWSDRETTRYSYRYAAQQKRKVAVRLKKGALKDR